MKLNYQKIAKMAGSMLGLDQNKLDSAIRQASAMTGDIHSRSDALNVLRRNGIDNTFLSKVQGIVNSNPMASRIAGMMGVDLNDIRKGLDDLQRGGGSPSNTARPSDDRVAQMRKRLDQARK